MRFLCFTLLEMTSNMHPLFSQASGMTHDVIGAAIEVHKDKGPGLLESIYEWCFAMELELRGHLVQNARQRDYSLQAISTQRLAQI